MSIPQSGGGRIENYNQLTEYLASGCKPKSEWRIGTEHEKFGYCKETLLPIPYSGNRSVLSILKGLENEYGWKPVKEKNNTIGLTKNGANVSLEPGGALELSGAQFQTIFQTCDEVNEHLMEVKSIADKLNIGFIGIGAAPHWKHDDMPMMPKGRYRLMSQYMDKVGTMGKSMMFRTCTVQVNLDYASETDMIQKMRVALALQPVATALFSNSPFFDGKPTDHKSWRSRIWRSLDEQRTGMLPFVFNDGFGYESWVEYALDVPMYFVYRNGNYINALGQSFRAFMNGELPALPGELPTLDDWADHLTTIFPEARLKRFIEMRGADAGQWHRLCALPAFWVGICYNQSSLDAAWDIAKSWNENDRESLRIAAAKEGLNGSAGNIKLIDIAKELVQISENGLRQRAKASSNGLYSDETLFLDSLKENIEKKKSSADELLEKYYGPWEKDVTKIFGEYSY